MSKILTLTQADAIEGIVQIGDTLYVMSDDWMHNRVLNPTALNEVQTYALPAGL